MNRSSSILNITEDPVHIKEIIPHKLFKNIKMLKLMPLMLKIKPELFMMI
jgi:hypothetical protein